MPDIDPIEGDVPASPKKICPVCGRPLSKYNKLGRCFHHPDPQEEKRRQIHDERLAREKEIAEKITAPQEEIASPDFTNSEVVEPGIPPEEKEAGLICDLFQVTKGELDSPTRQIHIARARHILMYLLYTDTPLSYPAIGDFLGGRDHTTVMHGVKKITEELESDTELQSIINYLRSRH